MLRIAPILFWKWGVLANGLFVLLWSFTALIYLNSFFPFTVSFMWSLNTRLNKAAFGFSSSSTWSFMFFAFCFFFTAERTFNFPLQVIKFDTWNSNITDFSRYCINSTTSNCFILLHLVASYHCFFQAEPYFIQWSHYT